MWNSILALALAAAPVPAAPPDTQVALVASPATALSSLRAFLTTASGKASVLAPGPLGLSFGSALSIDLLDPSSWANSGLDPSGPAVLAVVGHSTVLVLTAKDPKAVLARARTGLASLGEVGPCVAKSTTCVQATRAPSVAKAPPQLLGAVAVKGSRVAVLIDGYERAALDAALDAKGVPGLDGAKGLAGTVQLIVRTMSGAPVATLGLLAQERSLAVDGHLWGKGPLLAPPSATDPFGSFEPQTLASTHGVLSAQALGLLRPQVQARMGVLARACPACDAKRASAVVEQLSGPYAWLGAGFAPALVRGTRDVDDFFLASQAMAVGVNAKGDAAATALFAELVEKARAEKLALPNAGEHLKVQVDAGRFVWLGHAPGVVYLASSEPGRDALLGQLSGPVNPPHAAQLRLDGPRAARALGTLSMLDAGKSAELLALFGVAIEGSPLLGALGPVLFTADPEPTGARLRGAITLP